MMHTPLTCEPCLEKDREYLQDFVMMHDDKYEIKFCPICGEKIK